MHTNLKVPGVKMSTLTHQKAQLLRNTARGQQILRTGINELPGLLKAMEQSLQQQVSFVEQIHGSDKKQLLANLLDEHLYWEFGYYVLFLKWREDNRTKADPSSASADQNSYN
jgi:hypothetical protein